jgi:hypothetical protein
MSRSTLSYWRQCLDIYRPRRRPKYTRTFKCDCGWVYHWRAAELIEQHKRHQTIVCDDCGDVYRTLGGTITAIVPNPLNRSLVSEKTIVEQMSQQDLLDRHHHAAQGFSNFYETYYSKLKLPLNLAAE